MRDRDGASRVTTQLHATRSENQAVSYWIVRTSRLPLKGSRIIDDAATHVHRHGPIESRPSALFL